MNGNQANSKQDPSQSKHDLGWMQGTQAKFKQDLSQNKQDLGLNARQTPPKWNKTLAKVNKAWAKCTANQANIKQDPSQSKQDLG